MYIYVQNNIFGKDAGNSAIKITAEQLEQVYAENRYTSPEAFSDFLSSVVVEGSTIDFISKWEVEDMLKNILGLLPEPHDQYHFYPEDASFRITSNYYGETGKEDTFVKIFFDYCFIGLEAIHIPTPKTKSDLWEKHNESKKQIFNFILERAKELKVPLVVLDANKDFSSFVCMQIYKTNNICTIVEGRMFDRRCTTYIISGAGLEKEHAPVEKYVWENCGPRIAVVRHNQQEIERELVYVTPRDLFENQD